MSQQKLAPVTNYREGVPYLVVGKDVRAFLDCYRRRELGPVEWARSAMTARVFPCLDWHDPLAFVIGAGRGLWRQLLLGPKTAWHAMRRRAAPVRLT